MPTLCARLGRALTDDEGYALVKEAATDFVNDERGLVIWSLGQMGMIDVFDRIRATLPELVANERADFGAAGL